MDWFFASHERYLDFTHEVGFTAESLRQVMQTSFKHIEIHDVDNINNGVISDIKKNIARYVLGILFMWADSEGASNSIWSRSIIAVGKNDK